MLRRVWWIAGVLLVVGGAATAHHWRAHGTFGWFAYAPLEGDGMSASRGFSMSWAGDHHFVTMTGTEILGLVVAAVGALMLCVGLAYGIGHRTGKPTPEPPSD